MTFGFCLRAVGENVTDDNNHSNDVVVDNRVTKLCQQYHIHIFIHIHIIIYDNNNNNNQPSSFITRKSSAY